MGKNRKSKRQLIRDEKKLKRKNQEFEEEETSHDAKRQRFEAQPEAAGDFIPLDEGNDVNRPYDEPEREFFGMLADEEQEYFRRADEMLELDDFPSAEDRDIFLENVYKEAEGKELKLASSQSCSRLMERLIMLSNTRQRKHLFEAFASHFVTLVTHRFASHCCEKLFLVSAPVVTRELAGIEEEQDKAEEVGSEEKPTSSMEELFLLTLDELEQHLTYLLSDRFASHTLRVLLLVLSGRPLEGASTKSLLQSKKKEHISVARPTANSELDSQLRAVPESFTMATQKIIEDTAASMDATALRVLATHPTGNPVLQLLLELDISLNAKDKNKKDSLLLFKLLPGAPSSLNDATSSATDFINQMLYDPIGSRLIESIITHSPAQVFKGLHANFFGPRIDSYVRNDIASYPAIKALVRMGKDDLADAVEKILPEVTKLVERGRYNVLKTLLERCNVRHATSQLNSLVKLICSAAGTDPNSLVAKFCGLDEEEVVSKNEPQQFAKNKLVLKSHGCQLVTAMLSIPGQPSRAVQASLLSLDSDQILRLATTSSPTVTVLTTAFSAPSQVPNFHKALVSKLMQHTMELANSQFGHKVLIAIVSVPSKGQGLSIPFHLKEGVISVLASHERELRDSWTGRNVWRTWKGDLWSHRRSEWIRWIKEFDPAETKDGLVSKPKPWQTARAGDKRR